MRFNFIGRILAGLTLVLTMSNGFAQELVVESAWVRQPMPGASNSAAYLTVTNTGKEDVIVVAAYSNIADVTEVHEHKHEDGMMKMRHVPELKIEAGQTVTFTPGGLHLMLMGLTEHPGVGEEVRLCLLTKQGQEWHFDGKVRPLSGHE